VFIYGLIFPELLRRHAEGTVEFARRVLPSDDGRQFNDLVFTIKTLQAREQFVAHLTPGDRHGVGVFERDALGFVVERTVGIIRERQNFLTADAKLAADRSVDVLSELAAVDRSDAAINQRLQPPVNQP
jgi:hypothetical protein